MRIRTRKPWDSPGLEATPEDVYLDRRRLLAAAGFGALSLFGGAALAEGEDATQEAKPKLYPAKRNDAFKLDRIQTPELFAASYNNFYEFSYTKLGVRRAIHKFETSPWKIEFSGLLEKPFTLDFDDLLKKFALEERLYRFRCVEAWAMAVPWTGIPLRKVIEYAKPLKKARYVRFVTFMNPEQAPNQRDTKYPWPYHEGLWMPEATNELAMLVTGMYGKPLHKQNGAPVRLIVPWKYGYKSAKSIVKIEFVEKRPKTFWSTAVPSEYGFFANVNPKAPHPRWSQAQEQMLGKFGEYVDTLMYNGYEEQVASLYQRKKKS